jgi:hypothetical protein
MQYVYSKIYLYMAISTERLGRNARRTDWAPEESVD